MTTNYFEVGVELSAATREKINQAFSMNAEAFRLAAEAMTAPDMKPAPATAALLLECLRTASRIWANLADDLEGAASQSGEEPGE